MCFTAAWLALAGWACGSGSTAPEVVAPAVEQAFPGESGPVQTAFVATARGTREVTFQRIRGERVVEGDILLAPGQLRPEGVAQSSHSAQGATTHGSYRWPQGRIPYVFRSDLPADTQAEVNAAINHWQHFTSIRLVPRTTEANYVVFQPGSGCSSYVGMVGGAQAVTLEAACNLGSAVHEIGHAVGLWHEQSRTDRDAHVNIHWQNIQPGMEYAFQTYRERGFNGYWEGSDLGGYDVRSIMHYTSWAFSVNGQPTITTKSGGLIEGHRIGLTPGDTDAVEELYEGSTPAVVRLDATRLARVVRKPNTHLYYSEWNGSAWTAEVDLGGTIRSSPAIASWAPDRVDIFAIGVDRAVLHKFKQGTVWSEWGSLGGYATSAPAAVSWGPNRIDLVVRGGDNAIWHRAWDGVVWHGWGSIGGLATSAPTVTSWGPDRLDIFVRGGDNAIQHKAWAGRWYDWGSLGGSATSAPAATAWGVNRLDILIRGPDGAIWHKAWNGVWHDWGSLGGSTWGAPAVTARGVNQLDMFVRGSDGFLYQQAWTGSQWTGWYLLGVPMY
ncbi:hypothetical protein HPC49_39935 [Pyxidicoccus fallax]|uniref:Peptidase M12A domain-containing protein n=1 Tax=Pyxidicoccus fallax TaxID=394095 RepID=A0A848LMA0_9BACT|nr:M12 family metallopeptidase [Pyxidicoccus fallax]NMO18802.1 hypothetical protein [Pyxidicoccus fallax]NPC84370.1 hypothetical protein [Pyxidicoccus fallax]